MIIEESVIIHGHIREVWQCFTDVTCWKDWNTVIKYVPAAEPEPFAEAKTIKFCIRPFLLDLYFEPMIEEIILHERIVWSAKKCGITARHEFLFREVNDGVLVISRETFSGLPGAVLRLLLLTSRLRKLKVCLLGDLKQALEVQDSKGHLAP